MKSAAPKTKHRIKRKTSSPADQFQIQLEQLLVPSYTLGLDQRSQMVREPAGHRLTIFSRLAPAVPTVVYDSYWYFAAERQRIFFARLAGVAAPWTSDPILQRFKFTNAYRSSDRVSQYLIRNVIYRNDLSREPREVFFRILLFKVFNRIETWELLERHFGAIEFKGYSFRAYDEVLKRALERQERIYSAAYIMPPGSSAFGHRLKHQNHLRLIEAMIGESVPEKLSATRRMQDGFELLRSFPTIGDFLAYQFITDINYSELTDYSEREFVVPGPGARDGIRKCFSSLGGLTEVEAIRMVTESQEQEFADREITFPDLWGRSLQYIDCQNLFCEVDKYARVAHPEITGISGRVRIKQQYRKGRPASTPFYPPKWSLLLPESHANY